MHWNNNATRIRRELLMRLVQLMDDNALEQGVDRIPFDMTRNQPSVRCCIHHDRAILRLRLLARMGLRIEDIQEDEEHLPLAWHARRALARDNIEEPVLTVIDEACHACVQSRIFVTNACQGCMARPCMVNCPKKAISMQQGKAVINDQLCVNCGICTKACSYGAILKIPVPCEEACPAGAIAKSADGKEAIDFAKCISCGACMAACPFGAVTDRSQIVDVVRALKEADGLRPVVALVAPAVVAQFRASPATVLEALRRLGFHSAWEVAAGARLTTRQEAAELQEILQAAGTTATPAPALATSCCPAWVQAATGHLGLATHQHPAPHPADQPGPSPHPSPQPGSPPGPQPGSNPAGPPALVLSSTPSPMILAARLVREHYRHQGLPEPRTVFVGPCVAKRLEALRSPEVDFVLSSEELGAFLMARGVELSDCASAAYPTGQAVPGAADRGFAAAGGVAAAVLQELAASGPEGTNLATRLKTRRIDGLSREVLKDLRLHQAGSGTAAGPLGAPDTSEGPCQFLEVMVCQGGCVCGPSILVNPRIALGQLKKPG